MTLRIYAPTDVFEIVDVLGLGKERLRSDWDLAEPVECFEGADRIKLDDGEIVSRELTAKYGADVQSRYGLRFNPVTVLEIPENMHYRTAGHLIKKLTKHYGWAATLTGSDVREYPEEVTA